MGFKENFEKYKLKELSDISSSKRIFASEYKEKGIPFYRSKEIIEKQSNKRISNKLFISKERYIEIKNKYGVPSCGDLLLTSVGTLGVPYLVKNEEFYFKDGNLTWFRNLKQINKSYLYYWFFSPEAKYQITSKQIGSTQKALTISNLNNFEILIPTRAIQEKIVTILKSLDSKIEINNKIISNLESQAQAIFKSWFVDFEPFQDGNFVESELGMIPEGWEVRSLSDIAFFKNGLAMQKYRPEINEPSLPVLKIRELNSGSTDFSSDRCRTDIDDSVKVYDGDLIFSWSGTLSCKLWTGGNAGLNQHLFKVTSEKYEKWFNYSWVKFHMNKFIRIAQDKATTMGHIKRSHLDEAKVLIPAIDIYGKIDKLMKPIIELIIKLGIQNTKLAELRDALLPKLMAGEIDVSNIKIEGEEVKNE